MRLCVYRAMALLTFLVAPPTRWPLFAQEPPTASLPSTPSPAPAAVTPSFAGHPPVPPVTIPAGTRVPLVLGNALNTRTAKAGDSVYFETIYPIAVNNRIVIPMGTFVRGEVLEAKRPGRLHGRGELHLALEQMTYTNGYTIELTASPGSVDPNTGSGVNAKKTIEGPSSLLRDTTSVLLTTAAGAYVGTLSGAATNDAPGKGALIGGGLGGITGLVAVLATRGPEAELPRGTMMDTVFDRPLILDAALLPSTAGPGTDPEPRYLAAPTDARPRTTRGNHVSLLRLLPPLLVPLLR